MKYEEFSDEKLVEIAKSDENAVECLIKRYKGSVISLARKYFIQGGDIEDLISEGMIGLYRAIISFDKNKEASFFTFSYTLINRQLLNYLKKNGSKKNLPLNQSFSITLFENLSGGTNPETEALYKEEEEKINSKLKAILSAFELKVLNLFLKGLSYLEISEKLFVTEKKVDNALSRARKKIQNYF